MQSQIKHNSFNNFYVFDNANWYKIENIESFFKYTKILSIFHYLYFFPSLEMLFLCRKYVNSFYFFSYIKVTLVAREDKIF